MKSTRTILFSALAAGTLLAWSPARAQDSTNVPPTASPTETAHGKHHQGPNLDKMAATLNLTDDQKTNFVAIVSAQMQKLADLHQDNTLSQDDRRTKAKSIREDTLTQLKAILTPDQLTQFKNMMQQRPHRPPPTGNTDASSANLPPPQQ